MNFTSLNVIGTSFTVARGAVAVEAATVGAGGLVVAAAGGGTGRRLVDGEAAGAGGPTGVVGALVLTIATYASEATPTTRAPNTAVARARCWRLRITVV